MSFRVTSIGTAALLAAITTSSACYESAGKEDEVLAQQTIGPEGGTLEGGGMRLEVPANAVTADTVFEVRVGERELGARNYEQHGASLSLHPEGLVLRLPAELTFEEPHEDPAILFEQDGMLVAADGDTAWINELAHVARARAGDRLVSVTTPMLGATPTGSLERYRDAVSTELRVQDPEAVPRLNLVATIYDTRDAYERPLNGTSQGECGFKLENVSGGSLSANCAEGPLTATIRASSSDISFELVPHLSGKLDTEVVVGVVAGSEELAYQLGFFAFDTSDCFLENCSDHGTCVQEGASGRCECDEGYAVGEDPFSCECVPQCDGRECGSDSCGGQCGECPDGGICDDSGLCEAIPGGSTGDVASDDTGGDESTTGFDESSTTTGEDMGDGSTSTTATGTGTGGSSTTM